MYVFVCVIFDVIPHFLHDVSEIQCKTPLTARKQECIPVGCVPPGHWPYLIISYACPPMTMHAPQPCMPPSNHVHPRATMHALGNHACPPATTHTPWQPCTTPGNHACILQLCTPPATTHAPLATMHAPLWTEWQTGVKILPCPKLRLRAVIRVLHKLSAIREYQNYQLCFSFAIRNEKHQRSLQPWNVILLDILNI